MSKRLNVNETFKHLKVIYLTRATLSRVGSAYNKNLSEFGVHMTFGFRRIHLFLRYPCGLFRAPGLVSKKLKGLTAIPAHQSVRCLL